MDDDFEVEVSDLRTGQVLMTGHDVPSMPAMPAPPAIQQGEPDFELETTTLPPSMGTPTVTGSGAVLPPRPPIRRRQAYGAVATGGLIVVVLVAILGGVVSRNGLTFGLFPTPVPAATLAPGADTFYMVDGVPWGKLLADGKVVNVTYSQQQPAFFHLLIGRHTLEYDAAPFARVRCTVSVPAASSDSCPLYTSQDMNFESNYGIFAGDRGIDFKDTLTQLPPDQLQALETVAEQSLTIPIASTTVPVGGRYQGANRQILTAAQPLKAQVFFTLPTDPNPWFGQDCFTLCDLSFGNGGSDTGTGWEVLANVAPMWRYTDPSTGETVELPGTPQIPGAPNGSFGGPYSVMTLSVLWAGTWQVTPLVEYNGTPGCFEAMGILNQSQVIQNSNSTSGGYGSTDVPAPNPADGCLLAIAAQDQQGNLVSKPLWFLYRFGLVFAANPSAHKVLPDLPVVMGSEAVLVKQLATQLQPPWNS